MAEKQKDVLARITDVGEETLERLAGLPAALKDRMDDLQKKVRSLDPLERRVTELERKLEELTESSAKPASKPAASKPAASKKTSAS